MILPMISHLISWHKG